MASIYRGHAAQHEIMNPKQRVLATIKRQAADYLPIQLDITDRALIQLAKAWGFILDENTPLTILNQHLVFARQVPSREQPGNNGSGYIDAWGVRWATDNEGAWVLEHPLGRLDDLSKYRPLDVLDNIDWEKVGATINRYGEDYCIVAYQNALLFERAWSLVGFERILFEMYDHPLAVEVFLDAITDVQCAIARRYAELGVHIARTGDDWGSQRGMLFSPTMWRRLIRPRLEAIWHIYQDLGIPIIHHSCGDIRPVISDLVDLGLDVLNPVQPEAMNITEIAEQYGQDLSFYGGISVQNILPYGSPEDIRREVQHCVEILGKYGGYIIAPSQAITSDVPPENVHALLDAMQTYRASGSSAL